MIPSGSETDFGAAIALLAGTVVLGIRHGFDWDHIAAITDITSSAVGRRPGAGAPAPAGGAAAATDRDTSLVHDNMTLMMPVAAGAATTMVGPVGGASPRSMTRAMRWRAVGLGTMYALGHASVVAVLGLAAYLFGAQLPEWVDPIMGSLVGVTLLLLGGWLLWSTYRVVRHGSALRLRSRWMLIFDAIRAGRDKIRARRGLGAPARAHLHPGGTGSSYGVGTSYGVGMIHGIGAETATQILLITAIGGAAGQQLGIPLMLSFIIGLLVANTVIVGVSASGFVAAESRKSLQVSIGLIAGLASIALGALLFFGLDGTLPDIPRLLGG